MTTHLNFPYIFYKVFIKWNKTKLRIKTKYLLIFVSICFLYFTSKNIFLRTKCSARKMLKIDFSLHFYILRTFYYILLRKTRDLMPKRILLYLPVETKKLLLCKNKAEHFVSKMHSHYNCLPFCKAKHKHNKYFWQSNFLLFYKRL